VEGKVKALGYINNLFPGYTGLYKTIEECIAAFIPMWERVLTDVLNPLPLRIPGCYLLMQDVDSRCPKDDYDYEDKAARKEYWKRYEEYWNEWELNRRAELPDVPDTGYTGALERPMERVNLKGRELQVIVKLANIHLVSA
jgi:hypothetical protein